MGGNVYVIGAAVVGAALGFYLGKTFNRYVRSIGTAVIGAFLATRGLGSILGNYPNETDFINDTADGKFHYNPYIIGYISFMIILAVAGSIVQIKFDTGKKDDNEEEDAFANEKENQRCCC